MKTFAYMTASSPQSASDAVKKEGGRFLAGGIDLLGEMKEYIVSPPLVVNVKSLPKTSGVSQADGKWVLGANTTLSSLTAHPDLPRAVAEAAGEVGSPQIRNVATVGGNLAQHSRCWYYRHRDISCLKRGGSRCYARDGESRYSSVFTGNPCISPVVSNLAVALSTLGAQVVIQSGKETATWTIAELYARAWENPLAHNSLQSGDLILRVEIPVTSARSTYLQLSEKSDFDWALVSCAAAARVEGGILREPKVAVGVISPVPHVSEEANAFLAGKRLDEATAEAAATLLLKNAAPRPDNAYKLPMAAALIQRALLKLAA